MKLAQYNAFCAALPHTSSVVQWGGAHVWKVAGKVFALGRPEGAEGEMVVSFKASRTSFEMLKDEPGMRPAPYLASRGMIWLQRFTAQTLDDAALADYLKASHTLVAAGLPKRVRLALGFTGPEAQSIG